MRSRQDRFAHHLILLLGMWAMGSLASPLLAQTPDPGGWCGTPIEPKDPPPVEPPCDCPEQCTASPCYVASGNLILSESDLQIRTAGFPLQALRDYHGGRVVDGPTGYGWTSNLTSRLYYATYLFQAPSTYLKQAVITMPDGRQLTFTQNPDGVTYAPAGDRKDVLNRNVDGSHDLTLQQTRSVYHFDPSGSLLSMTDDYGNALILTYPGGLLSRVADAAGSGRYIDVIFGPDGRISILQDSAGRQVQYFYNPQGGLQSVIDAASRTTTYGYMPGRYSPLLSGITDNWGRVTLSASYHTPSDKVHTYTDRGETYTFTYAYQSVLTRTAKADSAGNIWTYNFGSLGKITDRGLQGGSRSYTSYNADGSVQSMQDDVGVVTLYGAYNPNGTPTQITRDYLGTQAVRFDYTYDPAFPEKVTSITPKDPATGLVNPDWQAWQYEYYQAGDPAPGMLKFVKRVKSDATIETIMTYVYNSHGQVTSQTSATGGVTDYGYDLQTNLTAVTGPANNDAAIRPITAYGPDPLGRILSVTDPLGKATTYTYDNLDRVKTVTLPKPFPASPLDFTTTYTYDQTEGAYPGLLFTYVSDPNGKITKQGYDQFGRLVKSIDAQNNVTSYGYTRDVLTSIADANNNVTTYGYDALRRLRSTTFPNSQAEQYDYWADGLLRIKTDRLTQTITFNYDRHKRLQSKVYPVGNISYGYTGQKLTTVTDSSVSPTETHTLAYDSSYRLQSDTQASRGTITRTYNADDTVATAAVQSGPTSTYSYYADGSLNTIQWSPVAGNFRYTYTLPGQYQGITFPNGQTRNFSYDDQGRLTQLTNLASGGANLATYGYGYDLNYTTGQYTMLSQRVSMTATVPSQGLSNNTTTYEYDPSYQLLKATYPNVAPFNGEIDSWTYDAIGNRLTNTINGSTTNYTYQKIGANPLNWQRLTSDGSNSYTYDSNGSALTRTGHTFGLNSDNRMVSISGAATASYLYDYQGRRSTKTVGSATTYLYDGLNLVREAGASSADYLFGPGIDEPLAMNRGGQVYYYETDALGSIAAITNSSDSVQNTYLYDAWGQVRSQTGSLANPFTYTSREVGEGGLNFYRARYYSSGVGRFLQEDPLWHGNQLDGGVSELGSAYRYVVNAPLLYNDPSGLVHYEFGRSCKKLPKEVQDRLKAALDDARSKTGDIQMCTGLDASNSTIIIRCGNCGGNCGRQRDPLLILRGTICINTGMVDGGRCGVGPNCLPSTLLHEIVHACGGNDQHSYGCEKRFYGDTCKQDRGCPTDCP